VKRAQCIDKAKTSLLDFCIGDALIKLRSNLRMSSIKKTKVVPRTAFVASLFYVGIFPLKG
jgi:hypothetical protein